MDLPLKYEDDLFLFIWVFLKTMRVCLVMVPQNKEILASSMLVVFLKKGVRVYISWTCYPDVLSLFSAGVILYQPHCTQNSRNII